MLTRGLANVLSTPISNALSRQVSGAILSKRATGFEVSGGRFSNMIVFVGSCFAGSAGIAFFGWRREKAGKS
jgi:MCP family monocarboxylic acid transporter-like MFS transporter 10